MTEQDLPTPYYQSETCTLYHADALDVLPHLPRASVGLLATDPPYGVGFQSGMRRQAFRRIEGDDDSAEGLARAVIAEALEVLAPRRHLYVFGPLDLATVGPDAAHPTPLVWDKAALGMGDLTKPYAPAHEALTFAVRVATPGARASGGGGLTARMRRGSVLRVPRRTGRAVNRHPTEKPTDLMAQLIESSSVRGDTVLDPFAGSGSTLVAATLTGRRSVGIELDADYCATASERVRKAEELAAQMTRA